MVRKVFLGICAVLAVVIGIGTVFLVRAHLGVRRERAPLPTVGELVGQSVAAGAAPVRLTIVNTATQPMPRAAVLEESQDPRAAEAYVMSHPSFVLEWADGRMLLIDAGMTRQAALDFGWPSEKLVGAEPIRPIGSVAEQLGEAAGRVGGIVFTHLHTDHVEGIEALCAADSHPISVFVTEAQVERANYTTQPGLDILQRVPCIRMERISGGRLLALEGFPGVHVIAAGGHTPGSQIVVAEVESGDGRERYAFTGDTVNNVDGVLRGIPKPLAYRLFIVPEDEDRQQELRQFLGRLREDWGATLLVSHDQLSLEGSGVPAWQSARAGTVGG